jgi:hypothetical protein
MKGISYITDEKNQRKAIVIDLKDLKLNAKRIYDAIDAFIAESRSSDPSVSLEEAKKYLRKRNRL